MRLSTITAVAFLFTHALQAQTPTLSELPIRLRALKGAYTAPNPQELTRLRLDAQAKLEAALPKLEKVKRYEALDIFFLGDVRTALKLERGFPIQELEVSLASTYSNLEQPIDFHRPEWQAFRASLRSFLILARAADKEATVAAVDAALELAATSLETMATDSQPVTRLNMANRVGDAYAVFVRHNQVPEAQAWLRAHFNQPNMQLVITAKFVDGLVNETFKETVPIAEVKQGVTVRGTANAGGKVTTTLHPNPNEASISIVMQGSSLAKNVTAKRGRVTVLLDSVGQMYANQALYFNRQTFALEKGALNINVTQKSDPHSASRTGRRGRERHGLIAGLALRMAEKEAASGESDRESAEKIKTQMQAELNSRLEMPLKTANVILEEKFRYPFERQGLLPTLSASTGPQALGISARFGHPENLLASSPFPLQTPVLPSDVYGYFHDSAFNNLNAFMRGETLDELTFQKNFLEKMGFTVDAADQIKSDTQASISLADEEPMRVIFHQGRIWYEMRLKGFLHERASHETREFAVSGYYELKPEFGPDGRPKGILLKHSADRPRTIRLLSTREDLSRDQSEDVQALQAILPRFLVDQARSTGIAVGDEKKKIGKLVAQDIKAENGWLVLGWKLIP